MIPFNCLNYENTKVTLELREMVNSGVNIWDFDYPSYYKGEEKKAFEQKVIDHFYFRQIGMETPGRWLHYFRTRVREIMPYYLQMYWSAELMANVEDPFEAYNLKEEYTRTHSNKGGTTGTSSTESDGESEKTMTGDHTKESEAHDVRKHSDTPQGSISNIETYMTDGTLDDLNTSETVNDSETATEKSSATASATSETTSEDEGTETYTLTRRGNIGVQPLGKEVQALRESFINIDMMIIHELNDLFLKVY